MVLKSWQKGRGNQVTLKGVGLQRDGRDWLLAWSAFGVPGPFYRPSLDKAIGEVGESSEAPLTTRSLV